MKIASAEKNVCKEFYSSKWKAFRESTCVLLSTATGMRAQWDKDVVQSVVMWTNAFFNIVGVCYFVFRLREVLYNRHL